MLCKCATISIISISLVQHDSQLVEIIFFILILTENKRQGTPAVRTSLRDGHQNDSVSFVLGLQAQLAVFFVVAMLAQGEKARVVRNCCEADFTHSMCLIQFVLPRRIN